MNVWRTMQRCLAIVFVLLRSFAWTIVVGMALANMGCAAAPIAQRYPQARVEKVCVRPPGVEPDAAHWVYADSGAVVSSEHPEVFDRIAREARSIYEHNQDADPVSVQRLPYPHNTLVCPERYQPLPPKPAEKSDEELPDERFFFAERCRKFQEENELRQAAMFLGQADPKPYVKDRCMVPRQTTARERAIQDVENQLKALGKQYGAVFGEAEAGLASVKWSYQGSKYLVNDIKEGRAHAFGDIQTWLAMKLESLPELPTFDTQEFAEAAHRGFEAGFGAGFDKAMARATALNVAATALLSIQGNVAVAVESIAVRTLRAALTRVSTLRLFVPGTVGGPGFFLRIPKPPPANANAPSLPIGVPPPPVGTPPPFGNLSRAAEFGIQAESSLAKAIAKTGLEKHHLLEQRFTEAFTGDPRLKLTVAVTEVEHQLFTNAWRQRIAYGTPLPPKDIILQHAAQIYAQYPAILKALGL